MTDPLSDSMRPYQSTAAWYDAIYDARGRDCHLEIDRISPLWAADGRSLATRRILDAGCGTGAHFEALSRHGIITGVDLSDDMLSVARRRGIAEEVLPGDLEALSLDRPFDLIVSLFGAFGYLADRHALRRAMAGLGRHLKPRGTILVEPPLFAECFEPPVENRIDASFEGGTLTRRSRARRVDDVLEIEFEWIHRHGETGVLRTVDERHRMLLLPSDVWLQEARDALGDRYDIRILQDGPIGRGLLHAVRKADSSGSD